MSDTKLKNNVIEAFSLISICSGIGYISKKFLKKNVTSDPSTSLMNYVAFSAVMVGAIYLRDYLIEQKIIPS